MLGLTVTRHRALPLFSAQRSGHYPREGLRLTESWLWKHGAHTKPDAAADFAEFDLLRKCRFSGPGSSIGSHPTFTLHSPHEADFPDSRHPAWRHSCQSGVSAPPPSVEV